MQTSQPLSHLMLSGCLIYSFMVFVCPLPYPTSLIAAVDGSVVRPSEFPFHVSQKRPGFWVTAVVSQSAECCPEQRALTVVHSTTVSALLRWALYSHIVFQLVTDIVSFGSCFFSFFLFLTRPSPKGSSIYSFLWSSTLTLSIFVRYFDKGP